MRRTTTMRRVLAVLASEPRRPWYGLEITDTAGLQEGVVYPVLRRMRDDGLTRAWETNDTPTNRWRIMHELTPAGAELAWELQDDRLAPPDRQGQPPGSQDHEQVQQAVGHVVPPSGPGTG